MDDSRKRARAGPRAEPTPCFQLGAQVLLCGAPAVVRMETATQVLLKKEGADEEVWMPKHDARLSSPGGAAGASAAGYADGDAGASEDEDDECAVCGQGGKLTCCDVCPRVYHLRCLPAANGAVLRQQLGADDDWWCPHCHTLVRLSFCMHRILQDKSERRAAAAEDEGEGVPPPSCAVAGGSDAGVAARLFEFMSDAQLDPHWEPLREAATALGQQAWEGDAADLAALARRAAAVAPEWWRGAFAESDAARPLVTASGDEVVCEKAGRPLTSGFRGVSRRHGKWKARIKVGGHDSVIGEYPDERSAARAYDKKARELHGDKAALNFPD